MNYVNLPSDPDSYAWDAPIANVPLAGAHIEGRSGYRMISSFAAKNFRPFRELSLSGLPAVNIIVGQSASGKTALLEAIRLALGATPSVAWTLNHTRGVPTLVTQNPTKDQFEAAWKSYFYDSDTSQEIAFDLIDTDKRSASVSIFFDESRPVTPLPNQASLGPNVPSLTNTIIPLAFRRKNFVGDESILDATVHQQQFGQLYLQQGSELGLVSEFFPSTWQANAQQVANQFSQLKIANRLSDIVQIISKQFPEIQELSSESPYGIPSVYAKLRHHSEMMPIAMVSSGINKFLSLLLAIRTYKGGVVLIDEIENGIYYKIYPALWEALHSFAVTNDTQLFISSHSWECLRGAVKIIDKQPSDFSLIQVSHEAGFSKTFVASGRSAAAAIDSGIEIRK